MSVKRTRDADVYKNKKLLRVRFKKLVRAVIMNQAWLSDAEEQGISMNVKKNVAMFRHKRKTGMLTMAVSRNLYISKVRIRIQNYIFQEKALMRSNPQLRTIEERKKLCLLIAGQECFSRIPPKIRARMAPVLEFMYINQSRVIIAEGDIPISLYFILNGEVEMKKNVYNKASFHIDYYFKCKDMRILLHLLIFQTTKQWTEVPEAIFGPGDYFGDVEMTESCPRMYTYTALSGCELLAIYDLDFDRILKPFMLKQWNEKKMALKAFDYFNFFTPEQIVVACKYGYLVQYEPLDTIYLGETGSLSYVRFVLSGECVILQCLNMKVSHKDKKATFELTAVDEDKEGLTMFNLKDIYSRIQFPDIADLLASSSSSEDQSGSNKKKKQTVLVCIILLGFLLTPDPKMRHMKLQDIEKFCGIGNATHGKRKIREKRPLTAAAQARKTLKIESLRRGTPYSVIPDSDMDSVEQDPDPDFDDDDEDISDYSSGSSYDLVADPNVVQMQLGRQRAESEEIQNRKSSASSEIFSATSRTIEEVHSFDSVPSAAPKDPIQTYFIDVGSLTYGSIFGLGEKMEHRVIMARTVVQCLLLPRYWLLKEEQNPGNIWNRRKFYFECNVPSRQDLFSNFLKTRKWNKFRHDYIQSLLDDKTTAQMSKEEDIPIMCRIVETNDEAI
ncbi:hypothetical protein KR054_000263 [Drosophila jambulina]|nr:hypothetical protein KR054_000263 [Drosophila jambulina]